MLELRFRDPTLPFGDTWQRVPIVVVAAHYLVADEAVRIGAASWLQKPVTLDRLVAAVNGACAPLGGAA